MTWSSELKDCGIKLSLKHVREPDDITALDDFIPSKQAPPSVTWGPHKGSEIAAKLGAMYLKVVTWKSNLFKLPSGAQGKAFVGEISRLIDMWTNKTDLESISFVALNVFAPIMLQKPSKSSKNKDHIEKLKMRLERWKLGEFDALLSESEAIQSRLTTSRKENQDHVNKVFVRLMIQGKMAPALRWITGNTAKRLTVNADIIAQLNSKHPDAVPPHTEALICGEIPKVEPVIFDSIDADAIFKSAKNTKGSAGPSGLDADIWRRIMCSASFGKFSKDACESVARMCRRLCTEHVDPASIATFTNCRRIPLDKNPGVRPIGIGEVLRRIVGKAVVTFLNPEILDSVGTLQLSAGQEGGCEAACHAMNEIFAADDCQGVLLVDATNACNSLNRATALLNVRHTCPEFATYLINTYRHPAKLFLPDGRHILSKEGTTQGDNCASGFYSISTMMLIKELSVIEQCKQIWYADDGGAGGTLTAVKSWWDKLLELGPAIGYYPNASKTWLVVKPQLLAEAKTIFANTGIKITEEGPESEGQEHVGGQRYLGAAIGSKSFIKKYIEDKVKVWVTELKALSVLAKTEPQIAYSAYTMGLCKRWIYVMRTIPDISEIFAPLEECIRSHFLPAILGNYQFSDMYRLIYSLPTKYGGLAIWNPVTQCDFEYSYSKFATKPLTDMILKQILSLNRLDGMLLSDEIKEAKKGLPFKKQIQHTGTEREIKKLANSIVEKSRQSCDENLDAVSSFPNDENPDTSITSKEVLRNLKILRSKGTSCWLTALPLKEFRYTLSKQEFIDAILLRYRHPIQGTPKTCACSKSNSIDHALSCAKGGYTAMRHNQIRDLEANMLEEVCKDVTTEAKLLPLTGEQFKYKTANTAQDARLDISARGVWYSTDKTFFDVRVFHDGNKSNSGPIDQVLQKHEDEKKRVYNDRVLEVEKSTFTPLVFSTSGCMGLEADKFHKRIATLISEKRGIPYSDAISHLRRKLRFSLLKTTLAAIRGHRGRPTGWKDHFDSDINLVPAGRQYF